MSRAVLFASAMIIGCMSEVVTTLACPDAGSTSTTTASPLPGCTTASDCAAYLSPGPCGSAACDAFGLVGEPNVPGIPKGCYVKAVCQ